MAERIAVQAGWLVVSSEKVLKDHGFIAEDGKIIAVKPNAELVGEANLENHTDSIVPPGFVNTHHHMYAPIKYFTPNEKKSVAKSLKPSLEIYWWPDIEDRNTIETISCTTKLAVVDMLNWGFTCACDILEAPNATFGKRLTTERDIWAQAGIKGVLSVEANERISTKLGEEALQENHEFTLAQMKAGSHIRGMQCTHTTFSSSIPFLRRARELSRQADGWIQIHMDEGPDEGVYCFEKNGKYPAQLYHELGFFDEKVLCCQSAFLLPVEISLMGRHKVNVTHQPISNALCGTGICPIPQLYLAGVEHIGIGTDGDMATPFEDMRFTYYYQRGSHYDATLMSVNKVFYMATEGGARASGFEDVGRLEEGYCADFLVIEADPWMEEDNVIRELVTKKEVSDIKAVYTDGVCRRKGDKLLFLDEEDIKREHAEVAREFGRTRP